MSIAGREVVDSRPVPAGDINDARRVTLDGGTRVFLKSRTDAAPDEYATEAAALRWLAEPGAIGIPEVIDVADCFLALEWLDAERRLLPLAEGFESVHRLCERIHDLAGPHEPPARLHGDLWSGNVLASGGRPYLIDPAAYGGHREVDLAMLRLFGSPGPRFLAAYEEVASLCAGHEDRVALYQLFPLPVHAALFGGGYAAPPERTARRYAA